MRNIFLLLIALIFTFEVLFAQEPSCISNNSKQNIKLNPVEMQNSKHIFDKSILGMTNCKDFLKVFIPVGQAEVYIPQEKIKTNFKLSDLFLSNEDMYLKDSVYLEGLLPAGQNYGVKLNIATKKLEVISPFNLTDEAKAAIQKSPKWLRVVLSNTLSQLQAERQKEIANVINNADDPYIDEIAYSIAYSSAEYLSSDYCFAQMFVDNATEIYSHDADLNYVEIVDYGTSLTDEDYYSTVKYYKINSDSNKIQIEVPKEIYYEYIVHPKITDEIPAYIYPDQAEYGSDYVHTLNISEPSNGVFWRDYLYNHTEERKDTIAGNYPILKDSVKLCEVLWDEKNSQRSAVREITKWINDVMEFTSKTERPHQPVRIYDLHIGRCGEHEDITAAAARACLIPCRGIEAHSSDHVWNEFWDEVWWQWEPVNNSFKDFYVYSKGWGRKFGSIFSRASSGSITPVTDNYCENTSKLNIYILDVNNKPVDGALVQLATKGTLDNTTILIDSYGVTDSEGKTTFVVEAGRTYYARTDCSIGSTPTETNRVVTLINNALSDTTYNFQLKLTQSMPKANYTALSIPSDTTNLYLLKVNYSLNNSFTNWYIYYDDLSNQQICSNGVMLKPNIFITDEENYNKIVSNFAFQAISKTNEALSNSFFFNTSEEKNWYCIFNNDNSLNNYANINASFALYSKLVSVKDKEKINEFGISIIPNPAESNVVFEFSLTDEANTEIQIYTSTGELVASIGNMFYSAGLHRINFDASNLANGMYNIVLSTGSKKISSFMIVGK